MSHSKKNKNRDPEAQKYDHPENRLVSKFLEMNEVDYTRNIIIPVLEAEGYKKIDFHHGQTEVGKDLILYRDAGLGRRTLVVAVIKSERISKTASGENGFPVILVQIDQARNNEVLGWDGAKRKPDEILVILADDPSHDILTSNPGGYTQRIQQGASLIFGSTIAELLIKHRPEIAEQILQSALDSNKYLCKNPTNIPLLQALNTNERIRIESIFTNLDASVGSTSVSDALKTTPDPSVEYISVNQGCWDQVTAALTQLENIIGPVLTKDLNNSKQELIELNAKANSLKNKEIAKATDSFSQAVKDWIGLSISTYDGHIYQINKEHGKTATKPQIITNSIEAALSRIKQTMVSTLEDINNLNYHTEIQQPIERIGNLLSEIKTTLETELAIIKSKKNKTEIAFAILTNISRDIENTKDIIKQFRKVLTQSKHYIPEQQYHLPIDINKLTNQNKHFTETLLNKFKSSQIINDASLTRNLLTDTKNYLSAIDKFKKTPELSNIFPTENNRHGGIGACVLSLMNSGTNLVLTGAAGSGKSTTLEMFARRINSGSDRSNQVIFLPLARAGNIDTAIAEQQPFETFCELVSKLFQPDQPGVTQKFVKDKINNSTSLKLIFDGLDEASHLTQWITCVIGHMNQYYKGDLQFIASSRFEVPELNNLGALNLFLLPFSKDQVNNFITDFLKNTPTLANEVISHLNSNPSLYSVAQTPLMSTILCSLAINGVTLPETKSALYRERFELLWGTYDKSKGIKRVTSSRSVLEDVSKKVAYYLHSNRKRTELSDNILKSVLKNLGRKYEKETIKNAFHELERPCNVLIRDVDDGLSFGHLSYQEYLAGDELYTCRQSEIVSHLADPWWRGALVHVAMKAEDIGILIEQRFMESGNVGAAYETLQAMIDVCEDNQKQLLKRLLIDHERLDLLDDDDNSAYDYS